MKILPAIRIHAWGGFGSQLFALLIANRLSSNVRFRPIHLVFHTSGVTERNLEIPNAWLKGFRVVKKKDFKSFPTKSKVMNQQFNTFPIRRLLKSFLLGSGIVATSNSEEEFRLIKPWVFSIRGHYTQVHLTTSEILQMKARFGPLLDKPATKVIAIHYRLGDLTRLKSKEIIDPIRVLGALKSLVNQALPLCFFSDSSLSEFENIAREVLAPLRYDFHNLPPLETMQFCCMAKEFIGTNSKLSLWIAILRGSLSSRITLVPVEIKAQLDILLKLQSYENTISVF